MACVPSVEPVSTTTTSSTTPCRLSRQPGRNFSSLRVIIAAAMVARFKWLRPSGIVAYHRHLLSAYDAPERKRHHGRRVIACTREKLGEFRCHAGRDDRCDHFLLSNG